MADPSIMFSQPNAGERFAHGFQQGQKSRQENMLRGAMAELARNPDNERAYQVLAEADPQAAMQYKQQRIEQARAGMQQHLGAIKIGAQIVRQVQPKDQAGWDQALSMAAQAGIPINEIPRQFDPNYAQQLVSLADVFDPPNNDRSRIITPQPGGGAFELGPGGNLRELIRPNDGSQPMGAPAGGAPQPGQVEGGFRFKGGNPGDPNAWEKVGGPTPQASGGFPPSGN